MKRIGGIELGGTKTIVVVAEDGRLTSRQHLPTGPPEITLAAAVAWLRSAAMAAPLDGIGIAGFGPLRVDPGASDHGRVLATPKPGWAGADLIGPFRAAFDCPIVLDTDVNAAALAEYRMGAARGCDSFVYLTIGTGVGGAVLIAGRPVHGVLHPEIGHLRLRRAAGDRFAGVCPFHGDCIEGLVSGPALAQRFGGSPQGVSPGDPRWDAVVADLAELFVVLVLTLSVQRIVVGGGVGIGQHHLLGRAARAAADRLGGYLPDEDAAALASRIVPPQLGADAGPIGATLLAGAGECC